MSAPKTLLPCSTAVLALGACLSAQEEPHGAFSATPFAFVFHDPAVDRPGGGSSLWRQRAGHGPVAPDNQLIEPLPVPGSFDIPDFNVAALEQLVAAAASLEGFELELDGISSGNDLLPVWYDFVQRRFVVEPEPGFPGNPGTWSVVLGSISASSQGAAGSWVAELASRPEGAGAEVIGYYVDGSQLPAALEDRTLPETGTLAFDTNTYPNSASPDIVAMDLFIPEIADHAGLPGGTIMPVTRAVYFSLTPGSLTVPGGTQPNQLASALAAALNDPTIDGGTVFGATWDAANGQWINLHIVLQADDLVVDGMSLAGANIDALAVGGPTRHLLHRGRVYNSTPLFMVSIEGAGDHQLLVHSASVESSFNQSTSILVTMTSVPVTSEGVEIREKMNIRTTDEVTAICLPDPEGGLVQPMIGSPEPAPAVRDAVHLSQYHVPLSSEVTNSGVLHLSISGWGDEIADVYGASTVFIVFRPLGSTGAWTTVPWAVPRTPDDQLFSMEIPAAWLGSGSFEVMCWQWNGVQALFTYVSTIHI